MVPVIILESVAEVLALYRQYLATARVVNTALSVSRVFNPQQVAQEITPGEELIQYVLTDTIVRHMQTASILSFKDDDSRLEFSAEILLSVLRDGRDGTISGFTSKLVKVLGTRLVQAQPEGVSQLAKLVSLSHFKSPDEDPLISVLASEEFERTLSRAQLLGDYFDLKAWKVFSSSINSQPMKQHVVRRVREIFGSNSIHRSVTLWGRMYSVTTAIGSYPQHFKAPDMGSMGTSMSFSLLNVPTGIAEARGLHLPQISMTKSDFEKGSALADRLRLNRDEEKEAEKNSPLIKSEDVVEWLGRRSQGLESRLRVLARFIAMRNRKYTS